MLSDENSMLFCLKATSVTSFTMQRTPHFTGNIGQDCPPIFNLKAL